MTSANEANGWYGGSLLGDQDESSEIYKHYAELCQVCTLTVRNINMPKQLVLCIWTYGMKHLPLLASNKAL